ncbi:hypothetical protein BDA96_05G093300 [Sorghum bicolor]|uniref:Uncharacterized protein n=1 Tax=Sorghum bicolor TaxID=4558 RepID=A0A921QVW0_SORBI|nr:hypothetical protein BDA96_05G093300 [Sorghum bicolor]
MHKLHIFELIQCAAYLCIKRVANQCVIDTRNVTPDEYVLYRSLCKWKGMLAEGATSPTVFKSKQVSATSNELVNSIAMGKCLSTIAIQVGTSVLSEDPSQVRKLIMSLWVSQSILYAESTSKLAEKAFNFLNIDYDLDMEKFQQHKVFTHAPDTRNTSLPAPVQLLVIW